MPELAALRIANATRFRSAKLQRNFAIVAKHLVEATAKSRYLAVAARTGVPWWFIAVVHERESSQSWRGSLAQGDPWDKVSVHIPAGRGPFKSWEDAAVDALLNCPPFAGRNHDWSIGGALTMLEQYNGLGYYARGMASPYLWAGTDQYTRGKFTRDKFFDPNAIDTQLGCAGLLMAMRTLDPSVVLADEAAPTVPPAPAPKPVPPSVSNPAPGSIGAAIGAAISAVTALFRRKP